MRIITIALSVLLLFSRGTSFSQPLGYYNGTENLKGEELKKALHDIIDDHVDYTYSRAKYIINESDADPANPANVILFYLQESRDANSYGTGGDDINREHVWAKSHGNFSDLRPIDGDAYNLRPADASVNQDRGNKDFDDVQLNGFQHEEALDCWYNDDAWEPGPATKGQVARILFYMATRYEGDEDHGIDLEVVNRVDTYPNPEHGKLSTLIKWHNQYPPSDFERRRNEKLFQIQQNRNPFVDHPEFVNLIWNSENPRPVQFSALSITPEKPHVGETATISVSLLAESQPDSVVLHWGDTFNPEQNSKKMQLTGGHYASQVTLSGQQAGETIWFTINAYAGQDTFYIRGSHVFPENISADAITPIAEVQGPGAESPWLDQKVTIAGRVTANLDNTLYIQDSSSERNGICIYGLLKTGNVGDSVVVRGVVAEYNTLTELVDVDYLYNFGDNKTVEPVDIHTGLISEAYEGVLVTLENVIFEDGGSIISGDSKSYPFSDDHGESVLFSEWSGRLPGKKLPQGRTTITGILSQYRGDYQLLARDIEDLSVSNHAIKTSVKEELKVYPNPVSDRLFIKSAHTIMSVTIVSASGSTSRTDMNDTSYLDVSGWQKGLYMLRFETGQDEFFYKKVLVR